MSHDDTSGYVSAVQAVQREAKQAAGDADAGLLVVHGVGNRERTVTLRDIVDPLLWRLTAQGQSPSAEVIKLGAADDLGGRFDAMEIQYTNHIAGERQQRRLVVVEARWNDVFVKSGRERVSAWIARNTMAMMWTLCRYYARGWMVLGSLATVILLVATLFLSQQDVTFAGAPAWLWCLIGAVLIGFGAAALDVEDWRTSPRWSAFSLPTLLIFQVQRALLVIVSGAGAIILPIAAVLLRMLSAIPFLSSFSLGVFRAVESGLMAGGFADMEAIANNHVTAAAVLTRVRGALDLLEPQLRPGATLTIVAHSGGTIPAWWLLTEHGIHDRQEADRPIRYRLLTVGAALNWALCGFDYLPTPLTNRLVNCEQEDPAKKTLWLNVWSSFDFVPHGPVRSALLHDPANGPATTTDRAPMHTAPTWVTWSETSKDPNLMVRNLGAPVPDEHGEYWRNQQEFVPALTHAIDEEIPWAKQAARDDAQLWSNCRLALISALVRLRLVILAIPIAALVSFLNGADIYAALVDCEQGTRTGWAYNALSPLLGKDNAANLLGFLCDNTQIPNALIFLLLCVLSYTLMDVYTNVCWHQLGRQAWPLRPAAPTPRWRFIPPVFLIPPLAIPPSVALVVWLPTVIALPLVLWAFRADSRLIALLTILNAILAVWEILWLHACLKAFRAPESAAGHALRRPIGRKRPNPAATREWQEATSPTTEQTPQTTPLSPVPAGER